MIKEGFIRFFLGLLLFAMGNVSAQNENAKWYFGNQAGLDFLTTPPTVLTNGAMNQWEGCSSVSTGAGNLLFYTDGATIWNSSHLTMANGTGLLGNASTTQGAIILKLPGSASLYYVFCLGAGGNAALYYSIVDMSLAAGAGSVTTKNVLVHATGLSEKMTYIRHCNGTDSWVVVAETATNGSYKSYHFSSLGLNMTAVNSANVNPNFASSGTLKGSPNGQRLASARNGSGATVDVFSFNPNTGVVGYLYSITTGNAAYGCEFSPDGTKLYAAGYSPGNRIMQWDLCAGSATAVAASMYSITSTGLTAAMQIGPDGKIYCTKDNSANMGVINNPNVAGAGCNYTDLAISLAPKNGRLGLPNHTGGYKPPQSPFTFTVSNSYGCQTASFTAPPVVTNFTQVGCSSNGFSLTNFYWDFGDPASGVNNTSTLQSPSHAFTSLSTFTVKLILNFSCGGGSDTLKQVVVINQPCITVTSKSITCASLGSATVAASGGIGPYSYTWMPSAQTTSVATGLSPGSYTLTVFDFGNNFTYTAITVFNSLIPLTGSISATASVPCYGAATGTGNVTNLTGGSGAANYSWHNGLVTYTTAFTNSLSAGVWTVTATDALTGCQILQTMLVTQPPQMNLFLSASSPSACVNTSVIVTGTNSGGTPGYTYTWTNGPATHSAAVSKSVGGQQPYILQSKDANGCLISDTIQINFISAPVISVNNVSVCPLVNGGLTANGANSYTWNSVYVGNPFFASPSASTQYTVIGSALGCTAMATASIILHPLPVPSISMPVSICQSASLQFTGSGGTAYSWAGPAGFSSNQQNPVINPVGLSHAGVFNLTVTSVNGCTASTSQTLSVDPTPSLAATGATVCTNQTLTLFSNSGAAAVFQWNGPLNFNSPLQNPVLINSTTGASGNYTVKVTSVPGCTNSTQVAVLVVPPPAPVSLLSSQTVCAFPHNGSPNSVTLVASGATTYSIFTGTGVVATNSAGPVSPLVIAPPVNSLVSFTLAGSNGVCTETTGVTFSVIANPVVTVVPAPVICSGESFTFHPSGANTYSWSTSTAAFVLYNNGSTAVTHPLSTASFSVYGQSLGCRSSTQNSTLTVNPLPVIAISPINPTICLNRSVALTATGTSASYNWHPAPGIIHTSGPTVNASPISIQTYTVTGSLNTCTSMAVTTVSVLTLPAPTMSVSSDSVCVSESLTLKGEGGLTYEWRGPSDFYIQKKEVSFVVNSIQASGVYSLTVSDANGCSNTVSQFITVKPLPQGSLLGFEGSGCVPLCSDFQFQPNEINTSAEWTINGNTFSGAFSYCFREAGTFTISGKLMNGITACENRQQYLVTVYPLPEANFNYLPLHPVENLDEVKFTNTSMGENQIHWNWFFINNSGYKSLEENPSYLFIEPGEYPVALVVTDQNLCQDTVVKVVRVDPDFALYIPDAFTPNGDGLNDVFLPVVRSSRLFSLAVYDRWGKRIFYSTSARTGWDGSFMGGECKMDVYNYQIIISTESGETKEYTGRVSLIR